MRRICLLVVLLIAGPAYAQPVSFKIRADVPAGHKPLLKLHAAQRVTHLRIELRRDDGKHFTVRRSAVPEGRTVTVEIGDGAAGKAKYEGTLSLETGGRKWSRKLAFQTLVRGARGTLHVSYDLAHLDLEHCVLEFEPSRPATSAELVVIGEDGKTLGKGSARYRGEPAGKWLAIRWTQPPKKRVMKMQLRVVGAGGLATRVELIPWSVTVDHRDVNFRTNSAVIEPAERGKLDASLARINKIIARSGRFMKMRLYIAGHTDTVGSAAKNLRLSRDRARSIARYFRRAGVKIPIAFAGFGERVLAVKTPDNTDEARNRRADYVLGPARGAPPFSGAYNKVRVSWKNLP